MLSNGGEGEAPEETVYSACRKRAKRRKSVTKVDI